MSALDFPDDPFWDWSVAAYGRPGVAGACIELQERRAIDVNLLLFCCWAARRGEPFKLAELRRIVVEVDIWHREAVRPLRAVRRTLKQLAVSAPAELVEAVRQRVASIELDAEHVEQLMLSRHVGEVRATDAEVAARAAVENLRAYAAASGFEWATEDAEPLGIVLAAAFPKLSSQQLGDLIAPILAEPGA